MLPAGKPVRQSDVEILDVNHLLDRAVRVRQARSRDVHKSAALVVLPECLLQRWLPAVLRVAASTGPHARLNPVQSRDGDAAVR